MRLKYFFIGCLMTIMLFLIVNIFVVINNSDTVIIKKYENFQESIDKIDKKISKVKDEECKASLVKMSNNIKRTNFNENISVDDYYKAYFSEDEFLNIYSEVEDNCHIIEDNSRYVLALSSYTFPSSIKLRYNLKHEIRFKDRKSRNELEKSQDEVGSYTSKVLELRVINELLEGIKA
ncbi:MAG: hypothetical protein OSJ65_04995 [Bacilli bacterium]|nr:hypothetical protein [Bacilli bacterium]